MTTYKAIATITWKFETTENREKALKYAKKQLEPILNSSPQGSNYGDFFVQVDISKMKPRNGMIHLASFEPSEIFAHLSNSKKKFHVDGKVYLVKMDSQRYYVFNNNCCCVSCGIEGTRMVLDMHEGDQSPHFNLYAEEDERLVLMTKDHILPKSKGGKNVLSNYQTMCSVCNSLKADYDLTLNDIRKLKKIHNNNDKLPKQEVRDLINKTRKEMNNRRPDGRSELYSPTSERCCQSA